MYKRQSLETPSLTVLGALSTTSLASFNPNPVTSLTAFITPTFEAPAFANTTSNSVFSSAAPPATAPVSYTHLISNPNGSTLLSTNPKS